MKMFKTPRRSSPEAIKGISDEDAAIYIAIMTKELMEIAKSRHFDGLAEMLRQPYQTAFAILSVEGSPPLQTKNEDPRFR